MRKKRTSGGLPRILRQGAALFTGAAALWLVWLTGDPAAARLAQPGDLLIIMCYAQMTEEEAARHTPRIVHVDQHNCLL